MGVCAWLCLCVIHMYHGACEVNSLLPCGSQRLNSGGIINRKHLYSLSHVSDPYSSFNIILNMCLMYISHGDFILRKLRLN